MDKDSSMSSDFKIGTLVFAKMKGFPYWPGVITNPTDELKKASSSRKTSYCIFFFGSRNYSLVEPNNLKLYSENKDLLQKKQTVSLKKAFSEMEDYIKKDLTVSSLLSDQDPFDSLLLTPDKSPKSGDKTPKSVDKTSKSVDKSPRILDKDLKDKTPKGTKKNSSGEFSTPVLPRKTGSLTKKDNITLKSPVKRKSESLGSEIEEKKRRPSTGVRASTRLSEINLPKFIAPKPTNIDKPIKPKNIKGKLVEKEKEEETKNNTDITFSDQSTPSFKKKEDNFSFYTSNSALSLIPRPESPPLIFEKVTDDQGEKNIEPSSLNFGFIGLGKMGSGIVKNLLESKHKVTVWNRTHEKCQQFMEAGAQTALTPGEVIEGSDITFCCVSDDEAAKDIVFGKCGILPKITTGKSYVEMSGISHSTSHEIAEAISAAGGRYLEVRFQGSKVHAENGTLILLAAGERALYDDCSSCFNAFSVQKSFLGEVGKASQVVPILNAHFATLLTGLSEMMEVGREFGLSQKVVLDFFKKSGILNPLVLEKCQALLRNVNTPCDMTIKDLQKNTSMTLQLASDLDEVTMLLSNTNEFIKKCIRNCTKDEDVCKIAFLR